MKCARKAAEWGKAFLAQPKSEAQWQKLRGMFSEFMARHATSHSPTQMTMPAPGSVLV